MSLPFYQLIRFPQGNTDWEKKKETEKHLFYDQNSVK